MYIQLDYNICTMNEPSVAETDAANDNTQVDTPLLDCLCCAAAVVTLSPQTHEDVPSPDNAREGTPLFDTLCRAAAVVTLSPKTHDDVASPGTTQGLSATINVRDTPNLLDYHHSTLQHIQSPLVNGHIRKRTISMKQKEHISSMNKINLKRYAKRSFTLDGKTILNELRVNILTVGATDLNHLLKVVYSRFNFKITAKNNKRKKSDDTFRMENKRRTRQRTTEQETESVILEDELDSVFPELDLSTTVPLITQEHQRLLLEEFAYLTVGQKVVVLVSNEDDAFESIWKRALTAMYRCGICFDRSTFNGKNFYSLPMCVASTPEREKMIDGSLTKAEIINLFGLEGGGGGRTKSIASKRVGRDCCKFHPCFPKM